MAGKRIILTADDYGAMNFIDDAIIECIKNGSINCVSCFVCFPTSYSRIIELVKLRDAERAKPNGNKFSIGLHFSITAGNPVLQRLNSLSRRVNGAIEFLDARLYPFTDVVHTHIQDELEAQLELLGQWIGGKHEIDHISNHHGVVYVDDELFTVYSDTAQTYDIPIRSPKLWSRAKPKLHFDNDRFHRINPLTRYGIYQLRWARGVFEAVHDDERVLEAEFKDLSFPYVNNDCVYGLGTAVNLDRMLGTYQQYTDLVTEFMFHLGYFNTDVDEEPNEKAPNGIDPGYFSHRRRELELLRAYQMSKKLNTAGVSPTIFRLLGKKANKPKP